MPGKRTGTSSPLPARGVKGVDKRHLGKIYPGLDLCDVNGAKIGTIARIYREDEALVSYGEPIYQEIVEVKTGFLGFGKRLYVPLVDVEDISGNAAFLAKSKKNLDAGWEQKPDYLHHLN